MSEDQDTVEELRELINACKTALHQYDTAGIKADAELKVTDAGLAIAGEVDQHARQIVRIIDKIRMYTPPEVHETLLIQASFVYVNMLLGMWKVVDMEEDVVITGINIRKPH